MIIDQIILPLAKKHKTIVKHGYTFDYKYNVFTGTKAALDAFLVDAKEELITTNHRLFWDGAYNAKEEPIYILWI